jgi:hypothetical protein
MTITTPSDCASGCNYYTCRVTDDDCGENVQFNWEIRCDDNGPINDDRYQGHVYCIMVPTPTPTP